MDRRILVAILLSLATVWLFNYYVGSRRPQNQQNGVVSVGRSTQAPSPAGQPIRVPTTQELYKPLALDVEFAKEKLPKEETVVEVETNYTKVSFSTYGALLVSLDFKEHYGRNNVPLRTVHRKSAYEEEQRKKGCFLLALDEKTPYVYNFVSKRELENKTEVTFEAENDSWRINKSFIVHRDSYQIDVLFCLEPKGADVRSIRPRLLFSAPFVGELEGDVVTLLSWNERKSAIDKHDLADIQGLVWFWAGTEPLFGAENRYFVHTLIKDPSKFVQRAYVKQFSPQAISPILEGPVIEASVKDAKKSWELSFYLGPKLSDHLNYIDNRLEEVLSFGWLSWLCKILLKLLSMIYDSIGNFGWAIVVMTVVLRLPFVPLSIYSRKKMEVYQHYQPSINKIRLKYKHDTKRQHDELMKFYKDHNISPTTHLVGCLPLIIQMPILFALYRVLYNYLDLYQAPFCGWIADLSSKDPYYVIPVLMGLSMLWQQRMTPVADDKQKVIMIFMSIVMTVVFANFPAGLVLYWFMNNVLTVAEDYLRKAIFR